MTHPILVDRETMQKLKEEAANNETGGSTVVACPTWIRDLALWHEAHQQRIDDFDTRLRTVEHALKLREAPQSEAAAEPAEIERMVRSAGRLTKGRAL